MRISDWSSDVCSSDLQVKIPTGIQSGREIRHRGAGMPVLQGRGRGDLVVRIEVETPTRLNARQKELLEAFRETDTGEECPESTGFFAKVKKDRKSVVEGKSVSVRVDLGGRRSMKKTKLHD